MTRPRGQISATHIAADFPYQVELRDLWGAVPLPEYDLGRAAQWFAPDGRWRRTSYQRHGEAPALRWAFAGFAAADAFHTPVRTASSMRPTTILQPVGIADVTSHS